MRGVGKTACTSFAACCSIERGAVRILSLWIGTLGRELITVGMAEVSVSQHVGNSLPLAGFYISEYIHFATSCNPVLAST
jgi:hypothetical protein